MKRNFLVVICMLPFLMIPLFLESKNEIVKIGPFFAFSNFKELSDVSSGFLGIDMAIRAVKKVEIWSSYKFSKTSTPKAHGLYDLFRLDAFATGLRYKPFRLQGTDPFIGIGLDYYHFSDDISEQFVFPVRSAVGPYVQAGTYIRVIRPLQAQLFFKYNLVKHTEVRTTQWGTYHYRIDFSGLEFGLGILFCIYGK